MENLTHYPVLVFAAAFVSLSLASESGAWLRRRYSGASDERNEALSVILCATLTLLAVACRHERRDQFSGLHPSGVLESYSCRRVVSNGGYCVVCQRAVRLPGAKRGKACSRSTARRLNFFTFDRRYRCAAAWPNTRQSAEPGKSGEITRALKFIVTNTPHSLCFRGASTSSARARKRRRPSRS